jgi:hypothetical protein
MTTRHPQLRRSLLRVLLRGQRTAAAVGLSPTIKGSCPLRKWIMNGSINSCSYRSASPGAGPRRLLVDRARDRGDVTR